jgi:hypothetical protein
VLQGDIKPLLRENCFNAYAVPQVHLAPGIPEHSDLPARLFRRRAGAKFYGMIHEQPETVLNKGIPKTFAVGHMVKIVHDGYGMHGAIDERWERNHQYMSADLQRNPERDITWFSYMRDCISGTERMVRESGGKLLPEHTELLNQAMHIYHERFSDPDHHWHKMAFPLYQRALALQGYPEFAFCMAGSVNGLGDLKLNIEKVRFVTSLEYREFMLRAIDKVLAGMYPDHPYPFEEE